MSSALLHSRARRRPRPEAQPADRRDAAVLYGAAALALGMAMLACGIATSLPLGLFGALLTTAGAFVSWRTSDWSLRVSAPLGLLLGGGAALVWVRMGVAAAAQVQSILGPAEVELSIALAVRMGALVVFCSFLMMRGPSVGFALVPALTLFGLVAGAADEDLTQGCFVIFLSAALAAVASAVLAPGEAASLSEQRSAQWALGEWRRRHWMMLGGLIAAILVIGYLLSAPVILLAEAYRWRVFMAMAPGGPSVSLRLMEPPEEPKSYPVGRGPFTPTDLPILSVSGQPAPYWRGTIYDQYTGSFWLRSQISVSVGMVDLGEASAQEQGSAGRLVMVDLSHDGETRARPVLEDRVRVETDIPFVIYSPGFIQRATFTLPPRFVRSVELDAYGSLEQPGGWFPPGATYEVSSIEIPMVSTPFQSKATSRAMASSSSREQGEEELGEVFGPYLTIPLGAQRVADLAQSIAGKQPTPESKLDALVTYLQRNCVYTLNAPAVPRSSDAADYFLFHQKRGYCDLFATALAVMARGVGIPTRFTTGFLEGVYDSQRDVWVLRDSDRHAWVEAYLPSQGGWVIADATPGTGDLENRPRGLYLAWLRARFFWQDHPVAAWLITLGVALVILWGALRLRRARLAERAAIPMGDDPKTVVTRAYVRLLRLLRRLGHPRRSSQTPLEYMGELGSAPAAASDPRAATLALALPAVGFLTGLFLLARYAPDPVTPDQARSAEAALAEAVQALRAGRR